MINFLQKILYKNNNIGSWLANNKRLYSSNKLDKDKLDKLNSLKYKVFNNLDENWSKYYAILQEYFTKNKSISSRTEFNGVKIGNWAYRQKLKYRNGKLNKQKIDAFNLISPDYLDS